MADKLLEFGLQKVWDLLARESERLRGVDEQLAELKRDLNLLRSFLKDANAQKHTKETVKTCVEEIKEIVFDVEDLIETFLLKKELGRTSGIRKRIQRLSCVMGATGIRKLALDLGTTSKRITKVNRDMEHYGVQKMIVHGGEYSPPKGRCEKLPLQERQREMRKTFHSNNESDFVGLDENVKKLVGYLVEEDSIRVISITGMGGIGKTTLAREVFNHKMVKNHFDGVAWVCISQEFTRKYVWQTMLQKLSSEHRDSDMTKDELKLSSKHDEHRDSDMAEDELQDKLYRLLETRKCLIVMDDMWKEEDWDIIKDVFPSKKAAIWKVLLTSRNEKVALRADPTCVTVKPECLTFEQSWTLFRGIAFPRKDTAEIKVDVEMEEMGKQMVNHCGGLPLAVKVLGGSLATKYTLHDWKRLSENIGSRLVGGRTDINDDNMLEINYVLSLSFEELPSYLKHCFLYLAHFPEDHRIDVEALSYYWAAERIFEPRYYDGETIRDVGDVCIEELVRRNMVISKRKATNLRFETCQLHDMMREICLVKAKEENFLKITSSRPPTTNFQSPVTSRRFVAHYPTTLHVERHIDNPKLRSLVVISHNIWKSSWKLSGSSYTRLEVLRVLDLFKAEFKGGKLPSGIGKLIHLRYLSLEDAKVIHLPSSLGNLKLLIYLNLSLDINREGVFVPNVLMGMKELRYLRLPWMHEKTMLELSNLVNLETLTKFNTKNGSIEDLQGMVRLRTLHIELSPNTSIETLSASIGGLKHLEDLTIEYDFGNDERKEEGLVWDFVDLKKLRLGIYMPRLPKEEHFPSHLTILDISCCHLEDDPMPILAKLLHLYEVKLGFESFCGKRMVCSGGGFPELQKLELNGLQEWEEWIVEESSMPLLHTLEIGQCPKLKKLPDGLHFPSHLTTIDLVCCGLEEDPIPILEKLVQLKWVNLRQCFSGRRMVFSAGGFPQLQKLRFYGQFDYLDRVNELEEWIVEEGSMAILNTMYILNCPNLKELPDGLQFINSLKDLKLDGKWKERLSEGGPDYYKVQHIPSVRLNFKKDMSFADSIKLLIEIEKQETRDAHLFSRILCI